MGVIPSLSVLNDGPNMTQSFQQHRTILLLTRQCLREMREGDEMYSLGGSGVMGSPTSTWGWDWTNGEFISVVSVLHFHVSFSAFFVPGII